MGYQSEAELENQLIKQLNEQGYKSVAIKDYDGLLANFREQFYNFKAQMDSVHIDLIPMVDVERSDGKPKKELQDSLKVLLDLLENAYGKKPMIYGTNRSYNELCAPEFNHYPLYIGRYGTNKPVVTGPSHYTIWQYSESARIPGIPKPVDMCRMHPVYDARRIKSYLIGNKVFPDRCLDPDLQSIQLSDLIDIRDGDIVHLEPPVDTGVVQSQLLCQLLSLDAVLAHGDPQERQPLETVLSDQPFNIHDNIPQRSILTLQTERQVVPQF